MPQHRRQVREAQEVQEREETAWKLRVEGRTQQQIADTVGLSQAAISLLLKRVGERHAEEFRDQAEAVKTRQSEQLERVFNQAMAAWERSLTDEERRTITKGRVRVMDSGMMIEIPDTETIMRVGQSGNPALLAQAMKALADIRSIWGLDAPKKVDATTGGEPFKVYGGFNPSEV